MFTSEREREREREYASALILPPVVERACRFFARDLLDFVSSREVNHGTRRYTEVTRVHGDSRARSVGEECVRRGVLHVQCLREDARAETRGRKPATTVRPIRESSRKREEERERAGTSEPRSSGDDD